MPRPNMPTGPFWVVLPPFPFRELDGLQVDSWDTTWHESPEEALRQAEQTPGDDEGIAQGSFTPLPNSKQVWAVFDLERGVVGERYLVIYSTEEAAVEGRQLRLADAPEYELSEIRCIHIAGIPVF